MHLASNSSGNLRLCCNSMPGKNMILDDQGKPYRLDQSRGSLGEIYNAEWIKSIRRSMMAGEKISICERCYTEEDAGVRSARQSSNSKYGALTEELLQKTQADGSVDFKPVYIDLRLGNLCNLKCRMCNPYASKKWIEDWNAIAGEQVLAGAERDRLATMDWFKSDQLVENLMSFLDSVKEIYFTGGEPLLINKHFELLEILIERGFAAQVALKYNTNITYVPEKCFPLWKHFKKVTVNVSLDGVGAINSYIRHPSKWSEILDNIQKMDQFIADSPQVFGSIHTTVQLYNLEHLTEVFAFVGSLGGFQKFPYLNILNHPKHLNIRNAPRGFKAEISEALREWVRVHREIMQTEPQSKKLISVIDYLNSKDYDLQREFFAYTTTLDSLRQESVAAVCPRLIAAFGDAEQTQIQMAAEI